MTRKDYIAIANAICEASHTAPSAAIDTLAHKLADVCANDNPRFDRQRFLAACGVPLVKGI